MFDPNVDIISVERFPGGYSRVGFNGGFKSSLVNIEEAFGNKSSTFIFDVMKKEGCGNEPKIMAMAKDQKWKGAPEFMRRGNFPLTGDSQVGHLKKGFRGLPRAQWLNPSSTHQKPQQRNSRRGPRPRSSQYRGVTLYRRTGRWESHIWDSGKQVYLGSFDTAHAAARVYDLAAIMFRGFDADINFIASDYKEDMKKMKSVSKNECIHILRKRGNEFSRGSPKYKDVTLYKPSEPKVPVRVTDEAVFEIHERETVRNSTDHSVSQAQISANANTNDVSGL